MKVVEFERPKVVYPSVIAHLEKLLKEAKDGEIESMCSVIRTPDGSVFHEYTDTENLSHLLSGVIFLQHRMVDSDAD